MTHMYFSAAYRTAISAAQILVYINDPIECCTSGSDIFLFADDMEKFVRILK